MKASNFYQVNGVINKVVIYAKNKQAAMRFFELYFNGEKILSIYIAR